MSQEQIAKALETECPKCGGEGICPNPKAGGDRMILCEECAGAGVVATDFGNQILAFVKRRVHFQVGVEVA